MSKSFFIKSVAVIGAGTMGAQIACLFASFGFRVDLFDLPLVSMDSVFKKLKALDPSPLGHPETLERITSRNLENTKDLEELNTADFVIEAVLEKLEIKLDLFKKIIPYLKSTAVLASNTSGLSINAMAEGLDEFWKRRFCGVHFFNPPRYLPLVELIPNFKTEGNLLDQIEFFLKKYLGKTVVRAQDTPNFIANRMGIYSLSSTMRYTEQFDLPLDLVDELTGKLIGRPKSATYRTADLVGLDIISHVVKTSNLEIPTWMNELIQAGSLGQKTGIGFYKKTPEAILVYDLKTKTYQPKAHQPSAEILKIFENKDWNLRFKALSEPSLSESKEAQFLLAIFKDLFAYAEKISEEIKASEEQIDTALKAGFGWKQGPFEIQKKSLGQDLRVGASKSELRKNNILFENEAVVLWRENPEDPIGVISLKTKMGAISSQVLEGMHLAIDLAEKELQGLVIYQKDHENFSVGADLMEAGEKFLMEGPEALEAHLDKFQKTCLKLRYSDIPVISAVRGFAFGGGCEFLLHSDAVVAAAESYIGLVELGVGLIPGAGGSKEFALRSSKSINPDKAFQENFKTLASAGVGKGAYWARALGFLRETDTIIANPADILNLAKQKALFLSTANYQAPLSQKFQVQGREGRALVRMFLSNLKIGKKISDYDYYLADKLAYVMTGGDLDQNSWVDESWILKLEREVFLELVEQEKTFQRIDHMLKTGKPLRN